MVGLSLAPKSRGARIRECDILGYLFGANSHMKGNCIVRLAIGVSSTISLPKGNCVVHLAIGVSPTFSLPKGNCVVHLAIGVLPTSLDDSDATSHDNDNCSSLFYDNGGFDVPQSQISSQHDRGSSVGHSSTLQNYVYPIPKLTEEMTARTPSESESQGSS
jgi:hypothetical protein